MARLGRFACPSDGAWHITRESVSAAKERGLSAEQMLAWLGSHALHEVPPLLAAAVRNWSGARRRAFLGELVVLQIGDAPVYEAVRASARARPFIAGTLGFDCLVVHADREAELRALLAELGFNLDGPMTVGPTEAGTAAPRRER